MQKGLTIIELIIIYIFLQQYPEEGLIQDNPYPTGIIKPATNENEKNYNFSIKK